MIFEKNNRIRTKLFQSIEGLTDEQFNRTPSNGGWSPKQIFEHLVNMETMVATNIAKELKNPNSPKSMSKPIALITNRLLKVDAPVSTAPTETYKSKLEMQNALYESHLFLLDVYESCSKEVLRSKSCKHPVFGQVPLSQWLPLVGLHEKRHLKQLREVIEMGQE
ncbi:DinB family protein [Sporosarcina sp. FSL K6-1522]|uniref:DinB family protein n=1 Tax=Sporosarcina sp. FSL K6-1522 TaxID=2921554 RepID=UPI00315A6045